RRLEARARLLPVVAGGRDGATPLALAVVGAGLALAGAGVGPGAAVGGDGGAGALARALVLRVLAMPLAGVQTAADVRVLELEVATRLLLLLLREQPLAGERACEDSAEGGQGELAEVTTVQVFHLSSPMVGGGPVR